ncbi:MAG: proline--tRNA ligase [Actinomycetota bacterium]
MRWSQLFAPTLRDAPSDAEAVSHQLLLRAGFARQLHSGHYSMLPLGWKVHEKVADIIRLHMNAMGAQEFHLPAMHPARIWQQSGRWEVMGDEMFRLQDRKGADLAMGMTHEEIFAGLAAEISSYKDLPQQWYQIQNKFRDEPRPKSGLLRVREFYMKDAYSFDLDESGLDASFDAYRDAYIQIFKHLSLPAVPVEASSGAMGGSGSNEFMVPSDAGEDDVVMCDECGYAANVERATSALPAIDDDAGPDAPEMFDTPGVRTIAALESFEGGAAADRQIKTMVMVADGEIVLALVRGDHNLNEQKFIDGLGAVNIRPASPDEAKKTLGAMPGSLGAVGIEGVRIVADHALVGRTNMTTGANVDDKHYRGVSVERDIAVDEWLDLRTVVVGEACPLCGSELKVIRCIEAGHIFKLGRQYAEVMGLFVLDGDGQKQVPIMGSYGIGVGRAMAAIIETHHDDNGVVWPVAVAPFEVAIVVVSLRDDASVEAAEAMYRELRQRGIDAVIDDRDARAGVKFSDVELIGIPYRITVGPKGVEAGVAELTTRIDGETTEVALDAVVDQVVATVEGERVPAGAEPIFR